MRKVVFIIFGLLSFYAQANKDSLDDILKLDISDLVNIEYTIASNKYDSLVNAPAIVTRLQMDNMRKIGLRTLKDVLSFVPGFTLQDAKLGASSIMIRGVTETFNQKILFLLDDVPYWMPAHSAIPLLGIPLSAIEAIEIIRGPGAVIYGTNASAGVIKVVTKKSGANTAAASYASHRLINANAYIHQSLGDLGEFNLSVEKQVDDGYQGLHINAPLPPPGVMSEPPPTRGYITRAEEFQSFLFNYKKNNFHLGMQKYQSAVNGLAGFGSLANQSSIEEFGYLLKLNNSWAFSRVDIKAYADVNNYYLEVPLQNHPVEGSDVIFAFDKNGGDNTRHRLGSTFNITVSDNSQLFMGVETEARSTGNYQILNASSQQVLATMVAKKQIRENSGFVQFDWSNKDWRVLLGARHTNNHMSGAKTTPRITVVKQLDKRRSLKWMYAEGFNSPNFTQQLIFIPNAISGNQDLLAESIKSNDIAYCHAGDKSNFVANLYHFTAEHFITRAREGSITNFINSGPFSRSGLELDYTLQLNNIKLYSNFSYHHEGNSYDNRDSTAFFAAQYNLNFGASFKLNHRQTIGASIRHIGERASASALNLVNINYEILFGSARARLSLRNLLDEKVIHPDIQEYSPVHLVPGGDERNFELGLHYTF